MARGPGPAGRGSPRGRQRQQADKFGRLAEESIGVHAGWEYDLVIDTSVHTPDEAAVILSDYVTRSVGTAQ